MIKDLNDSYTTRDEIDLKRKNLLAFLKKGDVLRFGEENSSEYFFVTSSITKEETVRGRYFYLNGKTSYLEMSLDDLAMRESFVAYFQEILLPR